MSKFKGLTVMVAAFFLTTSLAGAKPQNQTKNAAKNIAEKTENPVVAGPWTQLRKAPMFTASVYPLASTWGPTLPMGSSFVVEKAYGRWLFGQAVPLPLMKPKDFAPKGWIYTRELVGPGDEAVDSLEQRDLVFATAFHSRDAWKELRLAEATLLFFDFLESSVLSRRTSLLFRAQDEPLAQVWWQQLLWASSWAAAAPPVAAAEPGAKKKDELVVPEKPPGAPVGFSGLHLGFLHQETVHVQQQKLKAHVKRVALILKSRPVPALDQSTQTRILGRILAEQKFRLPALTHEEVDGSLYMHAVTARALEGCPSEIRDYWSKRAWFQFRVQGLKAGPTEKNSWYQFTLPGGYFAVSNKAVTSAKNEGELAFLLLRPLVRELRLQPIIAVAEGEKWPQQLLTQSDNAWTDLQNSASIKLNKNLDISDEISVDMSTSECLAKSGYHWQAGLFYLQRMRTNLKESWAHWFAQNATGLDYRIEQLGKRLVEAVKSRKFPESETINRKRFAQAVELWNTGE